MVVTSQKEITPVNIEAKVTTFSKRPEIQSSNSLPSSSDNRFEDV